MFVALSQSLRISVCSNRLLLNNWGESARHFIITCQGQVITGCAFRINSPLGVSHFIYRGGTGKTRSSAAYLHVFWLAVRSWTSTRYCRQLTGCRTSGVTAPRCLHLESYSIKILAQDVLTWARCRATRLGPSSVYFGIILFYLRFMSCCWASFVFISFALFLYIFIPFSYLYLYLSFLPSFFAFLFLLLIFFYFSFDNTIRFSTFTSSATSTTERTDETNQLQHTL